MMSRKNSRVAIIGTGASGLTALKALTEVGLTPVAFEAASRFGRIWVYRDGEDQTGPTYRSLRTNTSKQITAFSDLPFGSDVPNFPAGSTVEQYLGKYVRTFDLERFVRLDTRVESLRREADGSWTLKASSSGGQNYDWVLVCSGIFRQPVVPAIVGLDTFTGAAMHSVDYRVPERFGGRHVLVVGLGSSAVDIAHDLLGSADRVSLCTRRGAWVVPREVQGRPFDHYASRLFLALPAPARQELRQRRLLQAYRRHSLCPPVRMWEKRNIPFSAETAPSVTSDELALSVQSGAIDVKPAITRIAGCEVSFADGSRLHPDTIIFCTGYTPDFPFLSSELTPWKTAHRGLYRLVFPPGIAGLAFIGMCRAQGPILPIVEMQARWIARVVAGLMTLPTPDVMRAEIEHRVSEQARRGETPFRVALTPYMDALGSDMGVKPNLLRHSPLLRPLLTGPPVAAQYRLQGPDRWSGAADAVRLAVSTRRPTA